MCFNTVYPKWNPFPSFITLCSSERPKFYVNIIYSVSRSPKCGVIWNTSIVPSPHQIVSLYSISYSCQIVPVISKLLERSVCIFCIGFFLSADRRYVQEWDCWIIWYLIFSFLRKFSTLTKRVNSTFLYLSNVLGYFCYQLQFSSSNYL